VPEPKTRRQSTGRVGALKKLRDLTAILEVSRAMMAEPDLDNLLDLIIRRATEVLEAERTSLFLVDEDTNELFSRIAQDSEIREIRFPVGKGIAGFVARSGEIVNILDAYKDERFNPEVDKKTGYKTRTILCAPLVATGEHVIGVLQVLNKKDGVFTSYDEELISAFGAQGAVCIERTRLLNERELTFKSVLKVLGAAIDARDPVTAGHSERVARYAINMARALGWGEHEVRVLDYAAALHDIGKIGVRDDVLLKPGKLSPEEYEKMKRHALFTKEILDQVYFARDYRDIPHIASSHHERMDGTGYPRGGKGEMLTTAARILCVADVFDACTAYDRPYKRAMTVDESLAILEQGKGSMFDPALVDLFREKKLWHIDRREFQRIDPNFALEYSVITQDEMEGKSGFDTKVLNMSAGGLLFSAKRTLPIGSFLDVTVHIPDGQFQVVGRVVRAEKDTRTERYMIGVRFVNLPQKVQDRLADYLVEVLPQSPEPPKA